MNNRYREEEKLEEELEQNESSDKVDETLEDNKNDIVNSNCDDVLALQEEINKLKEENNNLKNQYLRTIADADNFKKRIDEERIRERKYASQKLLEKLVDNLDIFDKAVNMKTEDANLKNFLIGFKMINDNLKNILTEEGVKKINANGKFDPRYHHAVDTGYDENLEEDMILSVIKDGYMYKDRVLTAALVKVNKKPVEANDSEENASK